MSTTLWRTKQPYKGIRSFIKKSDRASTVWPCAHVRFRTINKFDTFEESSMTKSVRKFGEPWCRVPAHWQKISDKLKKLGRQKTAVRTRNFEWEKNTYRDKLDPMPTVLCFAVFVNELEHRNFADFSYGLFYRTFFKCIELIYRAKLWTVTL